MAANVLQCPIIAHYPPGLNPNITKDLHRTMYPLQLSTKPAAHILWTYISKNSAYPNHFVPLLPAARCVHIGDQDLGKNHHLDVDKDEEKGGHAL